MERAVNVVMAEVRNYYVHQYGQQLDNLLSKIFTIYCI